jgi:ubiquitin C
MKQIFIKTITGKTIILDVELSDTIESVKVQIYAIEGIHPDEQKLIFNYNILENDKTLSDYEIKHEKSLHFAHPLKNS